MVLDVLYLIYFTFYFPVLLCRGKWHAGFACRFGFLSQEIRKDLSSQKNIWVHAVSVGEVALIDGILKGLKQAYPDCRVVLSVTTKTGYEFASRKYAGRVLLCWAPLDLSWVVRRYIKLINPRMYVAAETELWPNLFKALDKTKVPTILVNGRISDEAFPRYQRVRWLFQKIMARLSLVCAQSETDALRFEALGVQKDRISVTGNAKFDLEIPMALVSGNLKSDEGFSSQDLVWVAASTHRGEEAVVIEAFKEIRRKEPRLRLVFVPRHPERAREVSRLILQQGLSSVLLTQKASCSLDQDEVLVVDAIGHLFRFYAVADIVFIGKSLGIPRRGGQNPLEAAAMGKVVVAGPFMENFKDVMRLLKKSEAIVEIKTASELQGAMESLLLNPARMSQIGSRAKEVVLGNKGASQRTVDLIRQVV